MIIGRLAVLFCGFIVGAALMNVCLIPGTMFSAYVLGIKSEVYYEVLYWLSLVFGFAVSFYLMWRIWPRSKPTESSTR